MSSSETSRGMKADKASSRDRDWKSQRDNAPHLESANSQQGPADSGSGGGSLRSRISDKKDSRSLGPASTNTYRSEPSHQDDDRDSGRKRTISGRKIFLFCIHIQLLTASVDREKGTADASSGPSTEPAAQPPKRPRIDRNRYQNSQGNFAVAKKLLATDPQAVDKSRSGRKD